MKWFVIGLLPMLSMAATVAASDLVPARDFTIYTDFAHDVPVSAVDSMRAELSAIMSPIDMHFDWVSLAEAGNHEAVFQLLVVRFRGACQVDILPPLSKSGPLGWTHRSNGAMLPFTDVDCDRIREIMGLPLAMSPPGERSRLLGRAMARVVAHEIYHFLGNTVHHSSSGVAKPAFNCKDLSDPELAFDRAGLDLLRGHVSHPGGEMPNSTP